jgi:hypothetical protein
MPRRQNVSSNNSVKEEKVVPLFSKKEMEFIKEANSLGFSYFSVGPKVLFANTKEEVESDIKKHKNKNVTVYEKIDGEWEMTDVDLDYN